MIKASVEEMRLGKCVVCGERVFKRQNFIQTEEGYTHTNCVI